MYIDNRGCYLSDTDKARGHVFIYVNNIAVTRKTYNSAGALMNIIYIILPRGVRLTLLKGHLRSLKVTQVKRQVLGHKRCLRVELHLLVPPRSGSVVNLCHQKGPPEYRCPPQVILSWKAIQHNTMCLAQVGNMCFSVQNGNGLIGWETLTLLSPR